MFLIFPTAEQFGYYFGQFIVAYGLGYIIFLGSGRHHKAGDKYIKNIILSSIITALLYVWFLKDATYGWLIILGIVVFVLAAGISWIDSKDLFSYLKPRVYKWIISYLFIFMVMIVSNFPIAFVSANANAEHDFLEGIRKAIGSTSMGPFYIAIFEKTPGIYNNFQPLIASSSGGIDKQKAKEDFQNIISKYAAAYMSRMSDEDMGTLLQLNANILMAAYNDSPETCLAILRGSWKAETNNIELKAATTAYFKAAALAVKRTNLNSPENHVNKDNQAEVGKIIVNSAGVDFFKRYQKTQDTGQQCLMEAQLRERLSKLQQPQKALVARSILLN